MTIVVPSPLQLTMLSWLMKLEIVVVSPLTGSYRRKGTEPEPANRELINAAPSPPKATAKVPFSPKAAGKNAWWLCPELRSITWTHTFEVTEESATISVLPSGDKSTP